MAGNPEAVSAHQLGDLAYDQEGADPGGGGGGDCVAGGLHRAAFLAGAVRKNRDGGIVTKLVNQ